MVCMCVVQDPSSPRMQRLRKGTGTRLPKAARQAGMVGGTARCDPAMSAVRLKVVNKPMENGKVPTQSAVAGMASSLGVKCASHFLLWYVSELCAGSSFFRHVLPVSYVQPVQRGRQVWEEDRCGGMGRGSAGGGEQEGSC